MRRTSVTFLALATGFTLAAFPTGGTVATATPAYTVRTLHFKVGVGPNRAQKCDIVGDLYLPRTASRTRPVPAIMSTNGFGGSKDDQAGAGKSFASRGYAFLSYSGLGFGGSGCKITLDDPDWDGVAGSQLISYLGGSRGIAYLDAAHTRPTPLLRVIRKDHRDHRGVRRTNDPRVGMIGGSYGGQVQFAVASVDARLDTIVSLITWSDLNYSLDPNNVDQYRGVSTRTPGAAKLFWALGFSGLGMAQGVENVQGDPGRLIGCPNFATFVCPALVHAGLRGWLADDSATALRHASVSSYVRRVRIPTLIGQGQTDTLFNLNEGVANYKALKAQGTPVKMIWHSWGHSGGQVPGEFDLDNLSRPQYEGRRVLNWFARYLKDVKVSTGPNFAYFRDWVPYTGSAAPAYVETNTFPVGSRTAWYLSGTSLRLTAPAAGSAAQQFLTPPAGAPTVLNQADVVSGYAPVPLPEQDLPGTFAAWSTPRLGAPVDVVGTPRLRVKIDAPLAQAAQAVGPDAMLVLFVRLQDVAPDGTATDIKLQNAPVRIPDVSRPVTISLPGIVHRFRTGHQIRLVVAGGSLNYRGGTVANPVTIASGAGQALFLPVTN